MRYCPLQVCEPDTGIALGVSTWDLNSNPRNPSTPRKQPALPLPARGSCLSQPTQPPACFALTTRSSATASLAPWRLSSPPTTMGGMQPPSTSGRAQTPRSSLRAPCSSTWSPRYGSVFKMWFTRESAVLARGRRQMQNCPVPVEHLATCSQCALPCLLSCMVFSRHPQAGESRSSPGSS